MTRSILAILSFAFAVTAAAAEPLRVGVSLLPLESLVKEIGGDTVDVRSLQGEGDSCSVFEPKPSAIASLANARLFFRIGAPFENSLLGKLQSQFPDMQVVDLRSGIHLIDTPGHHHDHQHHESCEGHGDPHIWLDPISLMTMAHTVSGALGKVMPSRQAFFQQRAETFCEALIRVDRHMKQMFANHGGQAFYIYHPALGYFAERYGLRQIAIETTGSGPSVSELHRLIRQAGDEQVRAIFVQPQESRRHAEIIAAAINARVIEINPMSMDLVGNIEAIGNSLQVVLEAE